MGAVAGNSGSCCSCDEFSLSGCGCGGAVPCSLICQSKSSTATLCGFSEYSSPDAVAPSDPPRKYRRQSLGGSLSFCNHSDVDTCLVVLGATENQFSGNYQYDKATCAEANGQLEVILQSPNPIGGACDNAVFFSSGTEPQGLINFLSFIGAAYSNTQTKITGAGLGCSGHLLASGSITAELGDEDTEDDAEARAAALIADWSDCSGGCLVSCSAFRSDRTGTGVFLFGFRKCQTKCQWTAVVRTIYNVRINFARRLLGSSGPFLDLGMPFEQTISALRTDESTDWVEVPNEAGWETVASSCLVTVSP